MSNKKDDWNRLVHKATEAATLPGALPAPCFCFFPMIPTVISSTLDHHPSCFTRNASLWVQMQCHILESFCSSHQRSSDLHLLKFCPKKKKWWGKTNDLSRRSDFFPVKVRAISWSPDGPTNGCQAHHKKSFASTHINLRPPPKLIKGAGLTRCPHHHGYNTPNKFS